MVYVFQIMPLCAEREDTISPSSRIYIILYHLLLIHFIIIFTYTFYYYECNIFMDNIYFLQPFVLYTLYIFIFILNLYD